MTKIEGLLVSVMIALTIGALVGLMNVSRIHAWEQANGYPFGKMCNSVFTLYVDTCNR